MRVVRVALAHPLEGLDTRPMDCVLGDTTLGGAMQPWLARMGPVSSVGEDDLDAPITGPALVLSDRVFASPRVLRAVRKLCRGAQTPVRFAQLESRLSVLLGPLQDTARGQIGSVEADAYELAFIPAGHTMSPRAAFALPESAWRAVPMRALSVRVPVPRYIMQADADHTTVPFTSSLLMHVRHWVHVLRLGHFWPQVQLVERAAAQPLRTAWRLLGAAALSKPAVVQNLKARMVYRGKGCNIHPTATVEASVLGAGVQIGAYAYVVGSYLGDGTVVEERANLNFATLGPRTFISKNSTVAACTVLGDTDVCVNGIQYALVAQRCALTSWARPLDTVLDGEVRVMDGTAVRPAGELPVGVCFGEGVYIGGGVAIAAGRALPAGTRVVADPDTVLRRLPGDVPAGICTVKQGTLTAL